MIYSVKLLTKGGAEVNCLEQSRPDSTVLQRRVGDGRKMSGRMLFGSLA